MSTPKTRLLHRLIQGFLFSFLVILSIFIFRPIQEEITRRMEALKTDIVRQIEDRLNRRISYSSISPSILRFIEIRDLVVYGKSNERPELLAIRRINIHYDIFELLFGDPVNSVSEISLRNTQLELDYQKDKDLIDYLLSLADTEGEDQALPSMRLSGRNLNISLTYEDTEFDLSDIFFSVQLGEDLLEVRFKSFFDIQLAQDAQIGSITTTAEFEGNIDPGLGWSDLNVKIGGLSTDLFSLESQTVHVSLTEDEVVLRKIQDRKPIDVLVRIEKDLSRVAADFKMEDFILRDLVNFEGGLESFNPWLRSIVSGSGTLQYRTGAGIISYQTDLNGTIAGPLVPEKLTFGTSFDGDTESVFFKRFRLTSSFGNLFYRGLIDFTTMYPTGQLALSDFTYGGIKPLDLSLTSRSKDGNIIIDTAPFRYNGVSVEDISLLLAPEEEGVSFESALLFSDTEQETISSSGSLIFGEQNKLDLSLSLDNLDVRKPYQIFTGIAGEQLIPDISFLPAGLRLESRLQISTDFSNIALSSEQSIITDIENKARSIEFSFMNSDRYIVLSVDQLLFDGYEAAGEFIAVFEESGTVNVKSDFTVQDIDYRLSGRYVPDDGFQLKGSYGIEASLAFGRSNQYFFEAKSAGIPIPIGEKISNLSFSLYGEAYSPADWLMQVQSATIDNVPLIASDTGSLSVTAQINPESIQMSSISFQDRESILKGTGKADYRLRPELVLDGSAELRAEEGAESYSFDFTLQDRDISLIAEINNSPLKRLNVRYLEGLISAGIQVNGTIEKPNLSLSIDLNEGLFNQDPLDLSISLQANEERVIIENLDFSYLKNKVSNVSGSYALGDGSIDLKALYQGDIGTDAVEVEIDIAAKVAGPLDLFTLPELTEKDFDANIILTGMPFEPKLGTIWQFSVSKAGGTLKLNGGPANSIRGLFKEDGEFTLSLAAPLPVRFEAEGTLANSAIAANLSRLSFEIEAFAAYLNLGFLRFLTGETTGNLRVSGPINDPDFFGTIVIENASAALDIFSNTMGPTKMSLFFQEKSLSIPRILIPVADGEGYLEGTFILDHWVPSDFKLQIQNREEEQAIHISYNFGGADVDGYAYGTLEISGIGGSINIKGRLTAESTSIALKSTEKAGDVDAEPIYISAQLQITSGKGVQFFWPSSDLPILRSFAETGEVINLIYSSDTGDFSLTGDVGIQGGEIFYFNRSFYIREGEITFNETAQSFDPRLSVRAEIREIYEEEAVKIFLIAENSKLSEFSPRFQSEPPLSEAEIASLLGGSIFAGSEDESIDLSSAILLTSDLISQFGIIRSFENTIRQALNLDLFSIRTHIFQNLLRGVIEDSSYPLDNDMPSLGKYLDNTTLFLGKYIGNDLFLELLIQLRAQNPYFHDIRSFGGLEVDSEISIEWKTPFFLLEWEFLPQHPEDLFLTDNTFSFSWEFSF